MHPKQKYRANAKKRVKRASRGASTVQHRYGNGGHEKDCTNATADTDLSIASIINSFVSK
eukprot:5187853-Pyramimonas_sp.AAC.1